MKKIFEIGLGDYSDDGHGKFDKFLVKCEAADLSDEILKASLLKSNVDLGFNIFDVASEYEDSKIDEELFLNCTKLGFVPSRNETPGPEILATVFVDDWPYPQIPLSDAELAGSQVEFSFSAIEFFMWWIGRNIPDFQWKLVGNDFPVLFGNSGAILDNPDTYGTSGFGYGLYY